MNYDKIDKKLPIMRNYGGKKNQGAKEIRISTKNFGEYDIILSKAEHFSRGYEHEHKKGKSLRLFSHREDNFYSMISINYNNEGLLEGFTKYILNLNNNQFSPVLRLDMGGTHEHQSNTTENKYFKKGVGFPHLHFFN